MMAQCGLGLVSVIRADADSARTQYDAIRSGTAIGVPDTFMPFVRLIPSSFMSTPRLLGLLAHTFGDSEQAVRHFEDAVN